MSVHNDLKQCIILIYNFSFSHRWFCSTMRSMYVFQKVSDYYNANIQKLNTCMHLVKSTFTIRRIKIPASMWCSCKLHFGVRTKFSKSQPLWQKANQVILQTWEFLAIGYMWHRLSASPVKNTHCMYSYIFQRSEAHTTCFLSFAYKQWAHILKTSFQTIPILILPVSCTWHVFHYNIGYMYNCLGKSNGQKKTVPFSLIY